jgi:hypothetical protein
MALGRLADGPGGGIQAAAGGKSAEHGDRLLGVGCQGSGSQEEASGKHHGKKNRQTKKPFSHVSLLSSIWKIDLDNPTRKTHSLKKCLKCPKFKIMTSTRGGGMKNREPLKAD